MSRSLDRTRTFRGRTTVATARSINLGRKTPAGLADPVSPPSEAAIRRHVLSNICPFCGAGPYKMLAGHTTKAHCVTGRELREMAGLMYSASITSPEFHNEKVERGKRQHSEGRTGIHPSKKGTKRALSPAAKKMQRDKALAAHKADPDLGRRASAASHAKERPEKMALYERVAEVHESVLNEQNGRHHGVVKEVAARLGWKEPTTRRRLRAAAREGLLSAPLPEDGRRRK